jgi:hypothetical protein
MDSRAVLMIAVVLMVRNSVNVERERLDLQRVQGQDDEASQAASHSPSLLHAFGLVNATRKRSQP